MPRRISVDQRLAERVRSGPGGCLEWTGTVIRSGYGQISVDGVNLYVHRVAWET
jgi:hypothetical protein